MISKTYTPKQTSGPCSYNLRKTKKRIIIDIINNGNWHAGVKIASTMERRNN